MVNHFQELTEGEVVDVEAQLARRGIMAVDMPAARWRRAPFMVAALLASAAFMALVGLMAAPLQAAPLGVSSGAAGAMISEFNDTPDCKCWWIQDPNSCAGDPESHCHEMCWKANPTNFCPMYALDLFKGGMKDGRPFTGKGFFHGQSNIMYKGEVKHGRWDGKGTMVYSNGEMYEGEWKGGLYDGKGTMVYSDGTKYEGKWKDGRKVT